MKHRIVVADDDPALLKLLFTTLTMRGFEVVTATDGRDAVAKTKKLKPALVVMDVNMPDLDGISAVGELRKDPATKSIPVLMISGLPGDVVGPEAFKEGVVAYIEKPFDAATLAREVRATLIKGGIKADLA